MHETSSPLTRQAPTTASIPRLKLGAFPTPVDSIEVEDGTLRRPLLVKRDDRCADAYAGNKVRKLEYLLADARRVGAQWLITAGAAGSHHAFATAFHGRHLGFDVALVLFPQSLTPHVRQMLLLDRAVGAELRWASRLETVPYGLWRARYVHRAERPYMVPPGGSNEIGTIGFVNAGLELAEQIASGESPRPTSVHAAAGTLGTVGGIAIGMAWAGLDIPIIATRITSRVLTNERTLAALIRSTLAHLARVGATPPPLEDVMRLVIMRHDHFGEGYGRPTAAGTRAQEIFAAAGLKLEGTYTAKAAAALLDRDPAIDELPLFWHTLSAVEPLELLTEITVADLPPPFDRYAG